MYRSESSAPWPIPKTWKYAGEGKLGFGTAYSDGKLTLEGQERDARVAIYIPIFDCGDCGGQHLPEFAELCAVIICKACSGPTPVDSNYCGWCGNRIRMLCFRCGKVLGDEHPNKECKS